jgi:hypothetical protein
MSDSHNEGPTENQLSEKSKTDTFLHVIERLVEFTVLTAVWVASIALFVLFIINVPAIYTYEVAAVNTILLGLFPGAEVTAAAVLAAIPWVAICVVGVVITVGTIVITILGNDPIGWLDREIERLKRLCPLFGSGLSLSAWLECRSRLSALRTVYWALLISIGVTVINVLVIYGLLGRGLPPPPIPPIPPF